MVTLSLELSYLVTVLSNLLMLSCISTEISHPLKWCTLQSLAHESGEGHGRSMMESISDKMIQVVVGVVGGADI